MINDLKLISVLVFVILILAGILKYFNHFYRKKTKGIVSCTVSTHLLKAEVSHKKYIQISHRTSILNNPMRQSGDFIDFVLPYINDESNLLENRLAFLECGESHYE